MRRVDALTSICFKTTEDGSRLFFPWGILGGAYAIASNEEFARLRAHAMTYYAVSLFGISVVVGWAGLLGGAAILPPLIVSYIVWARVQCRRLARVELFVEPSLCAAVLTCIAFFYFCMGTIASMLIIKRRGSRAGDAHTDTCPAYDAEQPDGSRSSEGTEARTNVSADYAADAPSAIGGRAALAKPGVALPRCAL